jgi:glycerol-3-phosphate dehydrogenase (NAD(P)+)
MQASGCNERYLPGYPLNSSLRFSSDLESALKHSTEVLVSVPSHSFASMIDCINRYATADCRVMWACKGFAPDSYKLLSDVVAVQRPQQECAVVSGPSFAAELVQGLPTAITVAASTQRHALQVSQWFQSDYFRAYPTDDIRGVQLGGALKNIYAIAAGISDGLGFGANARAALITRGLAELMRLADMLGARRDTLMGLSGMGDLILTCTDDKSRNRRFGLAIAQGLSVDQALDQIGQSVEGVAATTAARKLAGDNTIELPIVEQLHCVLQEGKAAGDAVSALLSREIKTEFR